MREKLYTYFRNKGIYARVYRTYLAVAIFTLLILAIVLSVTYSVNTIRNFRMREADSLNYYSDNIANELYRFDNIIIAISQNPYTQDILQNYFSMSEYERYATIEEITELTVEQLHMIDYVTDVVLITNNHECFQIYRGPHDDFYLEFFNIRELLQQSFSSQTNTTLADISSLTTQNTAGNRNGFFYVKRIIDSQNTSSNIGYILAYVDKQTFFGFADETDINARRYILNADFQMVYTPFPLSSQASEQHFLARVERKIREGASNFFVSGHLRDGLPAMGVCWRIPTLNWFVVSVMPLSTLVGPLAIFMAITLVLVVILWILQTYISRSIADSVDIPIKKILAVLRRVEIGDFTQADPEPYKDELAEVQESLNSAIHLLDQLFIKTQENERERYQLQLQALHAQMNPHFLMNALNSVILLAGLQGADNIKYFCKALSRLMQDLLETDSFEAPLEKELTLLEDYALIMRYRYFDRFHLEYDLRVPMDTLIPRSVLQPIFENALQHGMDEKTALLTVKASVYAKDGEIRIVVEDDGKGIAPEQLDALFVATPEELKKGKSIGLRNIDQRLRLSYGPTYGLQVESEVGRFTRVTVHLPDCTTNGGIANV